MEDWHFPFHMINSNYFGDVAIPIRQASGITFEPTQINSPDDFTNAVFQISNSGTGFLISISEIEINGVLRKVGLLVTAAHVVLNLHEGLPKSGPFRCSLGSDEDNAYFLREFATSSSIQHKCQSTNSDYCLPGDVAILLILLENCKPLGFFEPIDLRMITSSMPCYVSGFPLSPIDPKYSIQYPSLSDSHIENKMYCIFHKFKRMVFSHGQVVHENDTLIEISCSTTSGMSGSPIVSQGKYLGIYVGGPALAGQRELMLIINKVHEGKFGEVFSLIDSLAAYDHLYELPVFSAYIRKFEVHIVYILGKIEMGIELNYIEDSLLNRFTSTSYMKNEEIKYFVNYSFDLMYKLVWTYKERDAYCANIGISHKNDVFRQVDHCVQGFKELRGLSFTDVNHLITYLRTF